MCPLAVKLSARGRGGRKLIDYHYRLGSMANKTKSQSKAKKSRSGKKSKTTTPANRYLRYELTNSSTPGTETSHFIDLARDLSALNRRLMRQGRAYHVKRISIVSSNTIAAHNVADLSQFPGVTNFTQNAGFVSVSTAGDGWVVREAWKRGFKTWQEQQAAAQAHVGNDVRGTWNDFKVYLTNDMRSGGTILTPKDNGGNNLGLGEWAYTQLVTSDGTTSSDNFYLHLLGDHSGGAGSRGAVGLVKSYGESRATVRAGMPNMAATTSDDPLVNVHDHGTTTDEILDQINTFGDEPPYDIDDYPGSDGNFAKPQVVQQTTLGADGRASVGGFTAVCGLLELETKSPISDDVYSVLVELAPGNYRGIAADVI